MGDKNTEYQKILIALKTAAKPLGHIPEYKEDGPMIDVVLCSCGWLSNPYFDGAEYAWGAWIKHAEATLLSNKKYARIPAKEIRQELLKKMESFPLDSGQKRILQRAIFKMRKNELLKVLNLMKTTLELLPRALMAADRILGRDKP